MSNHCPLIKSDYFGNLLEPQAAAKQLTWCAATIASSGVDFDAIAFTGISGAITAPIVAFILHKPLIVVRKQDDHSTHSSMSVEGDCTALTYIVVDDFFSSGQTLRRIIEEVKKWSGARCVGAIGAKYPDHYNRYVRYIDPTADTGASAFGACPPTLSVPNLAYRG